MNHEVAIKSDGGWVYEECYCELSYDHLEVWHDEEDEDDD